MSLLPFRLLSFAFIAFAVMGVWLGSYWYGYEPTRDRLSCAKGNLMEATYGEANIFLHEVYWVVIIESGDTALRFI